MRLARLPCDALHSSLHTCFAMPVCDVQDFIDLDGNVAALWRIKYDDERLGEEDLDEAEVLEAMSLFAKNFKVGKPKVKTKKPRKAKALVVEKVEESALVNVVLRALQGQRLPLSGTCAPSGSGAEDAGSEMNEDCGANRAGDLASFLLPVLIDNGGELDDGIGWDMTTEEKLRVAQDKTARSLLQFLRQNDIASEHSKVSKSRARQMQQSRQSLREWAKCNRCKHTVWGDGTRPAKPLVIVEPILEPCESAERLADDKVRGGVSQQASGQRADQTVPRLQEDLDAEEAVRLAALLNRNPRRSASLAESKDPAKGPSKLAVPVPSVDDKESSDEDLPLAFKLAANKPKPAMRPSSSLSDSDSSDQDMPLAQKLLPKSHGASMVAPPHGAKGPHQKSEIRSSNKDDNKRERDNSEPGANLSKEEAARLEKRRRFRLAPVTQRDDADEPASSKSDSHAINRPLSANIKQDHSALVTALGSGTTTATPPAYKRVRVSYGTPGAGRCSWVRDLQKEGEERVGGAGMDSKRNHPPSGHGAGQQSENGSGGGKRDVGADKLSTSALAGNRDKSSSAVGGADGKEDLGQTFDVDFESASFLQNSSLGLLVGDQNTADDSNDDDKGSAGGQDGSGGAGGSGSGGSAGAGSASHVHGPCACNSGKLFMDCHGVKYRVK